MEEKKHWIFRWMCRCIIVNVIINGVGVLIGFITKERIEDALVEKVNQVEQRIHQLVNITDGQAHPIRRNKSS